MLINFHKQHCCRMGKDESLTTAGGRSFVSDEFNRKGTISPVESRDY